MEEKPASGCKGKGAEHQMTTPKLMGSEFTAALGLDHEFVAILRV